MVWCTGDNIAWLDWGVVRKTQQKEQEPLIVSCYLRNFKVWICCSSDSEQNLFLLQPGERIRCAPSWETGSVEQSRANTETLSFCLDLVAGRRRWGAVRLHSTHDSHWWMSPSYPSYTAARPSLPPSLLLWGNFATVISKKSSNVWDKIRHLQAN